MRLFVRPEKAGDFGAEEFNEGPWQHLLMLLCVLEIVLRVSQHIKESLDQLLVLWGTQAKQSNHHYESVYTTVLISTYYDIYRVCMDQLCCIHSRSEIESAHPDSAACGMHYSTPSEQSKPFYHETQEQSENPERTSSIQPTLYGGNAWILQI